jgi:magnesium-transporting ATPase (P-type)
MGSASTTVIETMNRAASRLEGLTQQEAQERLGQFGPNNPSSGKRGALLFEMLLLLLNPLVIILLVAILISIAAGHVTGAAIIFVIAMLRVEPTEFERGLKQFGMLIVRAVLFLILFILVFRAALYKDAFESLVFAVAAVGLTPEFLHMITSITLGWEAVRMPCKRVIVKHLPAIQNLGGIDIRCSDKTGTLTTGVMTLHSAVDTFGQASERPLVLAQLNSKFETGILSPLDTAILQTKGSELDGYFKCDEVLFTVTDLLLIEAAKRKFFAVSHHQATKLAEAAT